MQRKLFCELGPIAYEISLRKEALRKDFEDRILKGYRIARKKSKENLPYLWKGDAKILFRRLHGVDMQLQYNKATNLKLAGEKIDGIVIQPGEVFSLWNLVGRTSKRKGYLEGLTISDSALGKGRGGGLCQIGNLIHYLVLHTDLEVVEKHHHSDALFPDDMAFYDLYHLSEQGAETFTRELAKLYEKRRAGEDVSGVSSMYSYTFRSP